ncbi:MAG: DUF1236 domain-containing protein [Rhizobiales bacterium]|nr:DUF1236 domain-containing protein [Hyphomicrobiales bacterium]
MPHPLRSVTIAVAILGSAGLAAGDKMPGAAGSAQLTGQSVGAMPQSGATQAQLRLTSLQKQTIAKELSGEMVAPASMQAAIGAKVPESVALRPVPMIVANEIPSVKPYSYAKLQNDDIVLVDPKNRMVAAVIQADASTMGRGSGTSGGSMDKK